MVTDHAGDVSEPEHDPWLNLPEHATSAGIAFYRQHVEDLHLVASETMTVNELEKLVERVAAAVLPDRPKREAFPTLFSLLDNARQSAKFNLRARRAIGVTRYVDSFLAYIADLIGILLRMPPEALRSREQVSLEEVLSHHSMDEFIAWAADEKVTRLSYRGFAEIAEYVSSRFGLTVASDPQTRRQLVRAIATRNLIVHRRQIVDQRYIDTISAEGITIPDLSLGALLPTIDHVSAITAVLASVCELDSQAAAKFDLPTSECTPSKWWPGAQHMAPWSV